MIGPADSNRHANPSHTFQPARIIKRKPVPTDGSPIQMAAFDKKLTAPPEVYQFTKGRKLTNIPPAVADVISAGFAKHPGSTAVVLYKNHWRVSEALMTPITAKAVGFQLIGDRGELRRPRKGGGTTTPLESAKELLALPAQKYLFERPTRTAQPARIEFIENGEVVDIVKLPKP